jgi:hypothetical protein
MMDRIGGRDIIEMTIEMTIGMTTVMTTEMRDSKVTEREVTKTMNGKVWCRGLKN